jgi:predicted CoA-substrate-specific enzyme activase
MRSAGLDIGSRTVKLVICQDEQVVRADLCENSFDPLGLCQKLLAGEKYDRLVTTGYGRHLVGQHFSSEVISEIRAFSIGARHLFPTCRTILDIGGQDTKAIALDPAGKIRKFEMNDKCAAGTGRFLEMMAMILGYQLPEFGLAARSAPKMEKINSMCAVFAESEVVSMLHRSGQRAEIARGIHAAVISRACQLLRKILVNEDLIFVGGVALNPCMQELLSQELGCRVLVPAEPQLTGALGCALCPI